MATTEFAPPAELDPPHGGIVLTEEVRPEHKVAWLIQMAIDGTVDIGSNGADGTERVGTGAWMPWNGGDDLRLIRTGHGTADNAAVLDTAFAGRLSHVPRAPCRAVAGVAGLVRPGLDTAPPVQRDEPVSRGVSRASRHPSSPDAATGAAIVLRGAAVWIRQTTRRALRPGKTRVRDPEVSSSVPRLDRARRPRARRCRLANFGNGDRPSDRQIRRTCTGASISPSRSSGRHGVSLVTQLQGGGGRGDDARGTISPLREAE